MLFDPARGNRVMCILIVKQSLSISKTIYKFSFDEQKTQLAVNAQCAYLWENILYTLPDAPGGAKTSGMWALASLALVGIASGVL